MITITFKNDKLILTPMQIYRAHYSNMLLSCLEAYEDDIKSEEDFDKYFDKSSRIANISTVKMLRNKKAMEIFSQYMNDLNHMDALYDKEDLIIDIEEQQSNKYNVKVLHKNFDYIIDSFDIYAPNYETAVKRVNTLIRHKLPKEF